MLKNVNTTDLRSAIEMGCRTMGAVFNRDDNDVPFMSTVVWPKAAFGYSSHHAESHIPGRHLNALLAAEALVGVSVPEEVIVKHAAAARYSFDGPIPLPLNRVESGGEPVGEPVRFVDHNVREGLHALYALACRRGDADAHERMRRAIGFIEKYYLPDMTWNCGTKEWEGVEVVGADQRRHISGMARSIGPLVKYYRATGYAPALSVAESLAQEALKSYPESGVFDMNLMKTEHAHSISCTMSSLAQLAETLNDRALLERVRRFYDIGMMNIRDEVGWAVELTEARAGWHRGEINTSGDIVETALILGKYIDPKYFADAERILRGHILPSQLRDISFIQNPENPDGKDRYRDVAERHLGAFGFPAPYGHMHKGQTNISFNMDIVGGGVASLCEAYAACAVYENGMHRVNMLFDSDTDAISVRSPYTSDALTVTVKRPGPLFVRVPEWADRAAMSVAGADKRFHGEWLYVPEPEVGKPVVIRFELPVREVVLHHATHLLRARMRGDEVIAMENEGADYTFFPDF